MKIMKILMKGTFSNYGVGCLVYIVSLWLIFSRKVNQESLGCLLGKTYSNNRG